MTDTRTSTTPATEATADTLRGPWHAVLTTDDGFVIDNLDGLNPDDEVSISIRRGTSLPDEDGHAPGGGFSGDMIELWEHLYVEDGDPSTDAPARWAQAQAMAAGLNAAEELPHLRRIRDAAYTWRDMRLGGPTRPKPESAALIEAVDAARKTRQEN